MAGAKGKANQLDSIFTSIPSMYESPVHLPPVVTSDHQTIMWYAGKLPSKPTLYITCHKRISEALRQLGVLMNTTAFPPIHEATDPEVKVSVFTSIIRSILDKAVPLKRVSVTNNGKPWMTVQIKKMIKETACVLLW